MDDPCSCMKALSDPTRFSMVSILLHHDLCAGAMARRLGISEAAVSQHIKVLREAGLVVGERSGYFIRYSVDRRRLRELSELLGELSEAERTPCNPDREGCSPKRRGLCSKPKGEGGCPRRASGGERCHCGCRMFDMGFDEGEDE